MKLPKDARTTLRYNKGVVEALKVKGWTLQRLLDWAIEQNAEIKVEVSAKKKK